MPISFYGVLGFSIKVYGVLKDNAVFGKVSDVYSTWSVTIFSTIEGRSNPHCPPFFFKWLWVRFQVVRKSK
jgi:hypothetical protein